MSVRNGYKVPAVVVGGGINGLGVLRSLACAHVPVILLGSDADQPGMRSRYGRKVQFGDDKPDAVVTALKALPEHLNDERPVLILTQEETVSAVSAQHESLKSLYRFTLPAHDVLISLMHKEGFRAMAEAADAAVPHTLHIVADDQIDSIDGLQPPLVVKPSIRDAGYSSAFRKAYQVDTRAEAKHLVDRILSTLPDVVVQEWIEGSDSDIYFCLQYITHEGDTAVSFVGRKIRSWPPHVGGTASCAPASKEESKQLAARTAAFFRRVGVRGFASMEYKRDIRSGAFFMVEPTVGRTDYQEEVAALNGVNIPLAAYQAEIGLPRTDGRARHRACIWRDRDADLQSAARGNENEPWQPEGARIVNALWRFSDPMPATIPFVERAQRRALQMFRRTGAMRNNKEPGS